VTLEGIPVVSSFARSSKLKWSVAVGAPKAVLEAQMVRLIAWVGIGLATIFAVGLWLATRLARGVTTADRGLNDAALSIGGGKPVELPNASLIKADAVGAALVASGRALENTKYLAQHDALTGLCNRLLFNEMLERHLAAARRSHGSLAILAIDLDDFKQLNDLQGHPAGDRVLAVGERTTKTIRVSDVAARMGGDEFAVLLNDADSEVAQALAERLLAALSEPYEAHLPPISASIGIAALPVTATTAQGLLERAGRALYVAKHAGKHSALMDL
jgi:diguanylate cyclase (GGDEF)-like protein